MMIEEAFPLMGSRVDGAGFGYDRVLVQLIR